MKVYIALVGILLASCSGGQSKAVKEDSDAVVITHKSDTGPNQDGIDRETSWAPFRMRYAFAESSAKMLTGKLADPDYKSVAYGKDTAFQAYLTERINGVPVNFGGHYTIVEGSCGAMCVSLHMVDRLSGKIYPFPSSGDGLWGYRYQPNSTLLIGNASLLNDSMTKYLDKWEVKPEFYRWTGTRFEHLP